MCVQWLIRFQATTHAAYSYYILSFSTLQVQLILDKTASTQSIASQSPADEVSTPGEKVHMTWTKDKLTGDKSKNKGPVTPEEIRDLFSMKP